MKDHTPFEQQLINLHHHKHPYSSYWGWDTIVLACICMAFAVYFQVDGIIPVFIFSVYMLIMTSLLQCNWLHQQVSNISNTLHPHPLYGILKRCQTHIGKIITNAVFIFIPVGLILGASSLNMLVCVSAYIGYGLLLTATHMVADRVTGRYNHRLIKSSFCLVMTVAFLIPGVIFGYWWALAWTISDSVIVILLGTIVWNVTLSLLLLMLCRNLLNRIPS